MSDDFSFGQQILNMNISSISVFCCTLLIFSAFKSISTETCVEEFGDKFRCISIDACSAKGSQKVSTQDICGPLDEGQCCPVINKRSPPTCGIRKAKIVFREDNETQTNTSSEVPSIGKDATLETLSGSPGESSHNVYEKLKTSTESMDVQMSQKNKPNCAKNKRSVSLTENLETTTVIEFEKFRETVLKPNSVFKKNTSEEDSSRKNALHSPIPMAFKENLNNNQNFTNPNINSDENRSTDEKAVGSSGTSLFQHTKDSKVDKDSLTSTVSISSSDVYKQSSADKMNTEFGQRTTLPSNSEVSENKIIPFLITNMGKPTTQRLRNATKTDSNLEDVKRPSSVNPSTMPIPEGIPDKDDKDGGLLLQTIGGNLEYENWSWMVSIYIHSNSSIRFFCAGALIDDRHILTAAHCFYGHKNMTYTVSIGNVLRISDASDGFQVEEVILHEGFKPSCYCNDIAVIRLARPLTSNYTPVCLVDFDTAVVGEYCTVLGWGDTAYGKRDSSTKRLQKVSSLPIVSSKECRKVLSRVLKRDLPEEFEKYTICAGLPDGSKDACLGDSGGPLMRESYEGTWTLLGVVSFGYKCGLPGIPGTYSRLSYHMPWILNIIGSQ